MCHWNDRFRFLLHCKTILKYVYIYIYISIIIGCQKIGLLDNVDSWLHFWPLINLLINLINNRDRLKQTKDRRKIFCWSIESRKYNTVWETSAQEHTWQKILMYVGIFFCLPTHSSYISSLIMVVLLSPLFLSKLLFVLLPHKLKNNNTFWL